MSTVLAFDPRQLRDALGAFATGVTIVTARDKAGRDIGLTANSFNSVSLDPPMVLWSLSKKSSLLPAFAEAEFFAVHVLAADQDALSQAFARRGVDRFEGVSIARGQGGAPLLDGCAARFQCRNAFRYEGGDHVIFVGAVIDFDHSGREPLVFHGGRYGLVMKKAEVSESAGEPSDAAFGDDFLGYLLSRAHHQFYARLRPELERRGISDEEFSHILTVLGAGGPRRLSQLTAIVEFTGYRPTVEAVASLEQRGLVAAEPPPADPLIHLTDSGRALVVELMAIAKSIEADAEANLDPSERAVLRQLLKTVLDRTDPGAPSLWQRD